MASASHVNVKIALNDDYVRTTDRFTRSNNKADVIVDLIRGIQRGAISGKVLYHVEHTTTKAAQTVTFDSSAGSSGDYITICGIVFTVRSSPSYDPRKGEFLLYADDDDAQGEDFASAWNAHPVARHIGTAVNSSGVVTITMLEGGTLGNQGTLSTSNASFAAVGAATFASGAAGTTVVQLAVDPNAVTIL